MRRALVLVFASLSLSFTLGCESRGLGDPCTPEVAPEGGYAATETYVESGAVQCRTRACIVYGISGFPDRIVGSPACAAAGNVGCVTEQEIAQRIHCTCRCRLPGESADAPRCECGDGFHCRSALPAGPDGVRGGYCLRDDADPGYCGGGRSCPVGQSCIDDHCR